MQPFARLFPAVTGAVLLLAIVPQGWSQSPSSSAPPAALRTNSDRAPIPPGSSMSLYLYGSYAGPGGDGAQAVYQAGGNVFDARGRLLGKLVDSAGRDLTSPSVNGDYRLRSPAGAEIGTTSAPSSTAGGRTLILRPTGTGWPAPVAQSAPSNNGPVTTDQGGTTTGSAISSSIRAGVGGGLSETDQNTTTGTSSMPDPNNQPGPSGPIINGGGIVVAVPPGGPRSTPPVR